MDAIKTINKPALDRLNNYRRRLTPQQYKTLRGQILAGNAEGAMRGLQKLLERKAGDYEHKTRQGPGNSDRKQPKD